MTNTLDDNVDENALINTDGTCKLMRGDRCVYGKTCPAASNKNHSPRSCGILQGAYTDLIMVGRVSDSLNNSKV